MTGRGPDAGFAAPGTIVVVEHPPAGERVTQFDDTRSDRALLEVVLLSVDALKPSGLVVAVLFPHEHLDLGGEAQEAGVEVAGDPVPASVADTVRGLGGVLALMPAEQHDLGAVILVA